MMPSTQAKGTSEVANAGFSHLTTSRASVTTRISPDFLVLILDVNPLAWDKDDFEKALDAIIIFLNAHIAMQHENGLAIYAAGTAKAQLLYTSAPFAFRANKSESSRNPTSKPDANTYQHFTLVDDRVVQGIKRITKQMCNRSDSGDSPSQTTAIVSALSQALCHLNCLAISNASVNEPSSHGGNTTTTAAPQFFRTRILVISVTPDASTLYIPMMNCIFAAQKKSILIDICKLSGKDTVFLQQAAHLTGGNYFRIDGGADGLLQSLLSTYLPSRSVRELMYLPMLDEVDFRAACFCHRKIVDVGYVCSVCLSLFCEPRAQCQTCKSKYPIDTLERFQEQVSIISSSSSSSSS